MEGYRALADWERFPSCWDDRNPVCDLYPETYNCSGGGIAFCDMLYRRRSDGRFWRIVVTGDPGFPPDFDPRRLKYSGQEPADQSDIEGLVIVRPDGSRQRLWYSAIPPNPDVPLRVKRARLGLAR